MNRRKLFVKLNGLAFQAGKNDCAFFLCSLLFFLGSIAGVLFSLPVSSGDDVISVLSSYLAGFSGTDFASARVLSLFLELSKSAILTFIFSFSILGIAFIPCISFARGFSLSFTLSLLSNSSYDAHAAIFLVILRAFISVPVLLFISAQSFDASRKLLAVAFGRDAGYKQPPFYNKSYFFKTLCAFFLLFAFAIIEKFLVLRLLNLLY